MDGPTATIVASLIGGACSIIVALIVSGNTAVKAKRKSKKAAEPDFFYYQLSQPRRIAFAIMLGLGLGLTFSAVNSFVRDRDFALGGLFFLFLGLVIAAIPFGVAYVIQRKRGP